MIEKLEWHNFTSTDNPLMWVEYPSIEEITNKINEIIDYLNSIERKERSNEM